MGKAKAVTATARKIAVLFYNTLRHGTAYADPGATNYEERYKQRVLTNLGAGAIQQDFRGQGAVITNPAYQQSGSGIATDGGSDLTDIDAVMQSSAIRGLCENGQDTQPALGTSD